MGVVLVLAVGLGLYVRECPYPAGRRGRDQAGGRHRQLRLAMEAMPARVSDLAREMAGPEWLATRPRGLCRQCRLMSTCMLGPPSGLNPADDETLAHVGRLGHLTSLASAGPTITDAGLRAIEGLTRLRNLRLAVPRSPMPGWPTSKG